jgi:glycyl-tRNA synthetase
MHIQGTLKPIELKEVAECPEDELALVPSPATGEPGSLTPPRAFNLMFQTQVLFCFDGIQGA